MLLLVVGVVLAIPGVLIRESANTDGLFYEVHAEEVQGTPHAEAIRDVFGGPRGREAAAIFDAPVGQSLVLNPTWVAYNEQFYGRRWVVPAVAAGVSSATGMSIGRGMQTASMLAYALIGAAVFLLLRRRFGVWPSLTGAFGCLLLPPLYRWSVGSYVDSWGVLLETVGLLSLLLVVDRGPRWLWLWVVDMVLLSLTRDATLLLGICAVAVAVTARSSTTARRRSLWLVVTGALAAIRVALLIGAPLRGFIAQNANVPADSDMHTLVHAYFHQLWYVLGKKLSYPADTAGALAPVLYIGLVLIAGLLIAVALRPARGDAFWVAQRGVLVGSAVLLLLSNSPQGYRLELVLVPAYAAGVALVADRLAGRRTARTTAAGAAA